VIDGKKRVFNGYHRLTDERVKVQKASMCRQRDASNILSKSAVEAC